MTTVADPVAQLKSKKMKLAFPLLCAVLVLASAGGGYVAVSKMFPVGAADVALEGSGGIAVSAVSFVPLEAVVVNMPSAGEGRFLRFVAQLEVEVGREGEVQAVMPRISDAVNSYLRLLRPEDLSDAPALMRTKAQLLRRIRLATPEGAVRNLLIVELVMN